jgi:peptidoglycan-associated lipoprotein
MRNLAKTLIPAGMILACACGASNQTAPEVLNPPPAFAEYEPTRAPMEREEGAAGQAIAQAPATATSSPGAAFRIMAAPQPAQPQELEPVYFDFGSAYLETQNRDRLAEYAAWLKANPQQQVLIEGHTDAVGPSEYNYELGEQRAMAVRDFLIQLGIDQNRLQVVSRGEERPVSPEQDELNRRSEVVPLRDSISSRE